MKTEFETESGSVYTIDDEAKTWHRTDNPNSPYLRNLSGTFFAHSEIVKGALVSIIAPSPFFPGATRVIVTTKVIDVRKPQP